METNNIVVALFSPRPIERVSDFNCSPMVTMPTLDEPTPKPNSKKAEKISILFNGK